MNAQDKHAARERSAAHAAMLRDIEIELAITRHEVGKDRFDPEVMAALAAVPRERFVPEAYHALAFTNGPLPIGHGQTISQPYIVALMTDLLQPRSASVILEIGTGSGYQAAVLAEIVRQVYSIEVVQTLALAARERLAALGYRNVEVRHADGHDGWVEHAPYDGIVVTAAALAVPHPLVKQLKTGGRLVIPVGNPGTVQQLILIEKGADGYIYSRDVLPVSFVPLTRSLP